MGPPLLGFVLAAGLGTRIHVLSRTMPKPLFPIGLSTAFDRAVDALRAGGASRVVANASHLASQVTARGRARDVEVVVEDSGPFGTAGGLAHARQLLDADTVAIWNGDIVADISIAELARGMNNAHGVLAVRGREPIGKGNVGVARDGRIVRLRDQSFGPFGPFGDEEHGAWFAAVQILDRALVQAAPLRGCLVSDVLIPALARGALLRAVDTGGAWHDVGDLRSYLEANLADPIASPSARVAEGVRIGRAVLGEGAVVAGQGSLDRVVVWPNSRATAPMLNAVVTPDAVVSVEGVDAVA